MLRRITRQAFRARWMTAGLAIVMGALGFSAAAAPFLWPPRVSPRSPSERREAKESTESIPSWVIDPQLQAQLLTRSYRQPLFDPPPPTPEPPQPPPPPPPLQVNLLATMIATGGNQAMFSDASGKTFIGGVGAKLGSDHQAAEVLTISRDRVTVRYFDQEITLTLPARP